MTVLVSVTPEDGGLLVRRYDTAAGNHVEPTHQGGFINDGNVTPGNIERFRVEPPDICRVVYEDEEPLVA